MKQTIRLTESELRRIVKETVNKTLNESINPQTQNDYREFCSIFNGLTYEDAIQKAKELGLEYGAYSPYNNQDCGVLDINYKSILATLVPYMRARINYEKYDS